MAFYANSYKNYDLLADYRVPYIHKRANIKLRAYLGF